MTNKTITYPVSKKNKYNN